MAGSTLRGTEVASVLGRGEGRGRERGRGEGRGREREGGERERGRESKRGCTLPLYLFNLSSLCLTGSSLYSHESCNY